MSFPFHGDLQRDRHGRDGCAQWRFQRPDNMILSKDVIECQRTVFSGKDLVTHGSERLEDESPFEKKIESNCFKMLIKRFLHTPVTELT